MIAIVNRSALSEIPANHWPWLRNWHPDAETALSAACRRFPPKLWERGLSRVYYDCLWTLDEVLRLQRPTRVLDLGCGAGVLSMALRELGAEVTAVDRFDEYGETRDNQMGSTAEIMSALRAAGVSTVQGDILQDDLYQLSRPGQYDLILILAVIEHLPTSPCMLFRRLSPLLAPGGRIVVTTPNHAWLRTRLRLLLGNSAHAPLEQWCAPEFFGHVREYTTDEVRRLFEISGLKVVRLVTSSWLHASYRRSGDLISEERWTTRFRPTSTANIAVAASHLITALFPSLRYSILAAAEREERTARPLK